MARNVERDVQLREKQRNNILDKSRQLFAIRGLQGVRMQDIAQASGITPANVYHYFNSKEDLLMEVILQSQLEFREALQKLADANGTPWDKLVSIGVPSETHKSYLVMLHLSIALSDALPEEHKQLYKFNGNENLKLLSGILAEGQQQGQIKAGDPMQMAARYVISLSGFNVYCSTNLYEGIQFEFEDIIAHLRQE